MHRSRQGFRSGWWWCFLGALLLVSYGNGYSQDTLDERLKQAIALYEAGSYEQSITGLKGLVSQPLVPQNIRVEAYKYLGFNYWEQGNLNQAKSEFKNAFILNSQLQLGPAVSPLIVATFGEALSEFLKERREQERRTLLATTKHGAALRSLVAPGWGQMYRGHHYKGFAIGGISAATVFGLALADQAVRSAQRKYDNGKVGDDFDALDHDVKQKADQANLWAYGVAAVWAYNLMDTLIFGPNLRRYKENVGLGQRRQGIDMAVSEKRIMLRYQVSF